MSRFLFGTAPTHGEPKTCSLRDLRVRDAAAIVAMIVIVGLPWLMVQSFLFRSLERAFPLLTSRFAVSPDTLTAGTIAAYGAMLGFGMFLGSRFLRWFFNQQPKRSLPSRNAKTETQGDRARE